MAERIYTLSIFKTKNNKTTFLFKNNKLLVNSVLATFGIISRTFQFIYLLHERKLCIVRHCLKNQLIDKNRS